MTSYSQPAMVEKSQVVIVPLKDFGNEGRKIGMEPLAEVLELRGGDFLIPGGLDGADAFSRFRDVGFSEVAFGVALHVDDAELDIGLREETFSNWKQARDVVVSASANNCC